MFSLLQRKGRRPTGGGRRLPALYLEALETRDCPATPPGLTFTATILQNTTVQLAGTVTDMNPATCTVTFSGVATGSATPDVNGHYSLTTTASALGTVSAQAEDALLLFSNTVQQTISSPAPTLTLSRAYGANNTVILSGQVTGGTVSGRTVAFFGALSGSVVTDANGNYSYTTTAWNPGTVNAQTTDAWGQKSNAPTATLTNNPPALDSNTASQGINNVWTFSGHVTDEYAPGETVRLSGVPTLNGTQGYTPVTVGSDSWFRYSVQLTAQDTGWVSAVAYDWIGQASTPWSYLIS